NADYEEVLAEIKRLWNSELNDSIRNKLELLAMLAHRYEREREPLSDLDPIDAIKFRMEQRGLSRKDLLPFFVTTARVPEILSGKRSVTLDMIRKLHKDLDIPLESLVRPSKRPARAGRSTAKRNRRQAA